VERVVIKRRDVKATVDVVAAVVTV
jgi:hypothetical protein